MENVGVYMSCIYNEHKYKCFVERTPVVLHIGIRYKINKLQEQIVITQVQRHREYTKCEVTGLV